MNDINVFRNRSYPMKYRHTDINGNPVSLVGATLYFTVKAEEWDSSQNDATAFIQKTITQHSDPENGVTEWRVTDEDLNIDADTYYYDVIVEYGSNSLPPSLYGKFIVTGTPTNRNVNNG